MYRKVEESISELSTLCVKHGVHRLALFGSGTGNRFDPATSDLDFLVEFKSMTPAEHAESYFGLLEDLEALLKIPVDLIEPEPIRNPYFRESVEESRVVLYDAA
jgi:predicted nucleotidyltransferase